MAFREAPSRKPAGRARPNQDLQSSSACRRRSQALAESLLPVALAAARVQMAHSRAGVAVETKADSSPVTVADRESEDIILAGLARVAPGVPVVSEEAAAAGHVPAIGEASSWWTRSTAPSRSSGGAAVHHQHRADRARQPGVRPRLCPGDGGFLCDLGPDEAGAARLSPSSQRRTPCRLRSRAPARPGCPIPNALGALTSQTHLKATQRFLDGYRVIERRAVSSSLKFGLLARGEADVYPRAGDQRMGHGRRPCRAGRRRRHRDDLRRPAPALRQAGLPQLRASWPGAAAPLPQAALSDAGADRTLWLRRLYRIDASGTLATLS